MIRIDVSGKPRTKKGGGGGGGGAPSFSGEGPNIVVLLVIAAVVGLGGFWFGLYSPVARKSAQLDTDIATAQRRIAQLADVDKKFDQRQKEKDAFEKHVKVIDDLRAAQAGPSLLLNALGDTVTETDAVWLNNMNESGNTVELDGKALSTNAIANLITNLKRSGYFKSVDIKDAVQDGGTGDITTFSFTLNCEKLTATEKKS